MSDKTNNKPEFDGIINKPFDKKNHTIRIVAFSTLALILILLICFGIYKGIQMTSLPKCDSKFAEENVIAIFKENNFVYKQEQYNLGYISFEYPQATSYEKDIPRYECRAKVRMHALPESGGFNVWNAWGYIDRFESKYNTIDCSVIYSITKSRGENIVNSTYCKPITSVYYHDAVK